MDDRQRQITEGAGLQESRINQDFIDWLNKWGTVILTVVLVIALTWVGWNWWQRKQLETLDTAFADLDQAILAGSPDGLLAVAAEYRDRAAVPQLAQVHAADIFLQAARRGVVPGGDPTAEEDLLGEERRREFAERARGLYEQVRDGAEGVAGQEVLHLNALGGIAATKITLGAYEEGLDALRSLAELAREKGFENLASFHERRIEEIPPLIGQPELYSIGEIDAAIVEVPADQAAPSAPGAPEQPPAAEPNPLFDLAPEDPGALDPGLPPTGPAGPGDRSDDDDGTGETTPPGGG